MRVREEESRRGRGEEMEGNEENKIILNSIPSQVDKMCTYVPIKLQSNFLCHWLGPSHVTTGEINESNTSLCEFLSEVWDLPANGDRRSSHSCDRL